jgi:hypothetical protein
MNTRNSHPLEQEELMAYVDGELRPDLATIAAAHLENCAECRATTAEMSEMSRQLAAWEIQLRSPEIPQALNSAVDAHVKSRKRREAARHRTWRQVLGPRRLLWAGGGLFAAVLIVTIATSRLSSPKSAVSGIEDQIRASQSGTKTVRQIAEGRGQGGEYDRLQSFSRLSRAKTIDGNGNVSDEEKETKESSESKLAQGPMIVRTAQLAISTKEFDKARADAEAILKRHSGYIGQLRVSAPANSARTLNATFRIPSAQLDATLAELKALGRVEAESQGGEEVTQQYVDLEARLANARHTEQRLSDLLRDRTGKLSDVLAFEKEIDRVRYEIESMEAQRKSLAKQVSYATLTATLTEDYGKKLEVVEPSTSTQFRNAAVDGYRAVADGVVGLLLFLLSAGPSILIWGGLLFWIGWLVWKRIRRRIA